MTASLGLQLDLPWAPSSVAQVVTTCRLLCSSWQSALAGHRQLLTLACTSWKAPKPPDGPGGQLQTLPKYHLTTSTSDILKRWTQGTTELCWSESCFIGLAPAQHLLHGGCRKSSKPTGPEESLSHWHANNNQNNYNRRVHTVHMGSAYGKPSSCDQGGCTTGP